MRYQPENPEQTLLDTALATWIIASLVLAAGLALAAGLGILAASAQAG